MTMVRLNGAHLRGSMNQSNLLLLACSASPCPFIWNCTHSSAGNDEDDDEEEEDEDDDDDEEEDDDDEDENVDEVANSFARSRKQWEDKQTAPSAFIVSCLLPIMGTR